MRISSTIDRRWCVALLGFGLCLLLSSLSPAPPALAALERVQPVNPEVYVSSPTMPLIEWGAEDTLFRPRIVAGPELEEALEREREEIRRRARAEGRDAAEEGEEAGEERETPAKRAAELRAEQASGLLSTIESITMLEDASLNGYYFIPADPSGAVGPNHVLSVVNSSIRWHTTGGTVQNSQRLGMNSSGSIVGSFFESLSPINSLFDPKAYYDTQAGRFLVVALEKGNSPTVSRILLAVSDDSDPNGTWYYLAINSKVNIGGNDCWADYPSLGVDEQAVYITNNMFTWPGAWGGNRLWIVDKTAFYAGSGGSATIYDPWALAGASGYATTCMVASVFGTPPAGNTGTWLLSYSGLTDGTNEYIGFMRVDNPIASPTFTYTQVNCGNVDNTSAAMPKSSQPGTAVQLEMNDNRALAACYRNNRLYLCAQVVPPSGADAGQATVHWWKFNSTTPASISMVDHGNIGGEEIASGTYTSFPSIAVDASDNIAVGFSASGGSVYPGAYYAVHAAADAAGTMQTPVSVATGVDFYYRAFGGSRNRWGDYTVTAVDPTGSTFWTYNKYALSRGSILGGYPTEDGRWGTRWASFTVGGSTPLSASLTSPNGGESWGYGTAHNITWSASGGTAPITVDLDYSTNGGGAWTSITTGLSNSGSYSWSVPAVATANARVRVTAHDAAAGSVSDASNADFTISDLTAPTVSLTAPAGGESWASGTSQNITWTASDNVGVSSIKLELSTNNGGSWANIALGEPNDGTYTWSVPAVGTSAAKVRVTAYDLAGNSASSTGAVFTITVPDATPPTVSVTAPNGGESWGVGTSHSITWTASDNIGVTAVSIDYSANNGGAWTPVASGLANSGTYSWTTPGTPTTQGLVRVTAADANANSASDVSNSVFSLVDLAAPTVSVTAPTAGNSWVAASSHNITWTASDNIGVTAIRLEFSSNNGSSWSDIAVGEPNDGSYTWSVPAVATAQAKVRVTATDAAANSASATSAVFTITVPDVTPPSVTLTAPNGGGTLAMGGSTSITWTAADNVAVSAIALYYSTNNGGSWNTIATGLANSGTRSWTVPNVATTQALVRVVATDAATNSAQDESDATFAIADQTLPTVAVTAPGAGVTWVAGSGHAITWTASDNVGVTSVQLELSTDNGGSWSPIAAGLSNSGSYSWTVPGSPTTTAKVRVTAQDAAANSKSATSGTFTISNGADATPPTVQVASPNGGEAWGIGTLHALTWSAADNVGVSSILLEYSANAGGTWTTLASGLANSGSWSWTTPGTPTTQGLVRVTAADAAGNSASDVSDAVFSLADLTPPAVGVTAPTAGASWVTGSTHAITWTATDNVAVTTVSLDYSTNGGAGWTPIASGESNDGLYSWVVPNSVTDQALVRVTAGDAAGNHGSGQSGQFAIVVPTDVTPPGVMLTAPNGGESWAVASGHAITWNATDDVAVTSVTLEYSANGGTSWSVLAGGLANSGSWSWNTPGTPTAQARIRVTAADAGGNSTSDQSDANFALVDVTNPSVTISAPGPASSWTVGSSHPILWNATDDVGVVAIALAYSTDNGGSWTPIAGGEANDGSYNWLIPNAVSAQARVRVTATDAAGNAGSAQSLQFTIAAQPDLTPPTITLTAPNGGEVLAMGASVNVTWTASDNVGVSGITVQYSATGGAGWSTLATGEPNDGTFSWTVPPAATTLGLFKVTAFDGNGNSAFDQSNAVFEVRDQTVPVITLTNPAGPVVWTPGDPFTITWSATDNVGVSGVDIDFSRDDGATWQVVAVGEPNDGAFLWTIADLNTVAGVLRLTARDAAGNTGTSQVGDIIVQPIVPVTLVSFLAARDGDAVVLEWEITEADRGALFHVHRQEYDAPERRRLTATPLSGRLRYSYRDEDPPGAGADYWLEQLEPTGTSTWYGPLGVAAVPLPAAVTLAPTMPNPFRATTTIAYALPEVGPVRLLVHDVQGRTVARLRDGVEVAGPHQATWDGLDAAGRPVAPGIYFLTLEVGAHSVTRKIVRVR